MFQRLRPGYATLLGLGSGLFVATASMGIAPLSIYYSTTGMLKDLLLLGLAFPLFWLSLISVEAVRRRFDHPSALIWRYLRRNRNWLMRSAVLSIAVLLLGRSFMSYKSGLGLYSDYWADPMLADFDVVLFGVDPWRLTHSLIGPFGTMLIDRVYQLWFFVMMATAGWFCFTRNAKLQLRGLLSYLLSWGLLGCLAATSLASVGPAFYHRFVGVDRFGELMARLKAIDAEDYLTALDVMEYLERSYGLDRLGAGISAMPSLHVAIAVLCFLAVADYARSGLLKVLAWLFAAVITVGSVHLGWHYASDGLFSIVAVVFFWWASGRFVDWLELRDQALAAPAATPAFNTLPANA